MCVYKYILYSMCIDTDRERERVIPMLFSAPTPLLNDVLLICFVSQIRVLARGFLRFLSQWHPVDLVEFKAFFIRLRWDIYMDCL